MLDWNLITISLGAITAFLAFLYNMLKSPKDSSPKGAITEHDLVKEQIANIRNEVNALKIDIQNADEKTMKTLERFENRIEKLTDIIIEHLRSD